MKLWLCSGGIIQIPCSRIVHLSKSHTAYRKTSDGTDFIGHNLKRVAEVWLDDYKKYFYRNNPERYEKVDAGDLSEQFALKKRLNCKPFKYFLDEIATEMLERYPLEPQYFATGSIQLQSSRTCLGLAVLKYEKNPILVKCNENVKMPPFGSDFILTFEKSIKLNDTNDQCFNSEKMNFENCYHQGYYQHWIFNINTSQIISPYSRKCLTGDQLNQKVFLALCDKDTIYQKWTWGKLNMTALRNWNTTGVIWSQ